MVMVNGTMGPTGANATFTITPRPAGLTAVRLLTYNPWTWTNQNLFWWPLDPTTEYTLRVTNDIDELGLSSVSFYSNQW
jgi:hypothetical protein